MKRSFKAWVLESPLAWAFSHKGGSLWFHKIRLYYTIAKNAIPYYDIPYYVGFRLGRGVEAETSKCSLPQGSAPQASGSSVFAPSH